MKFLYKIMLNIFLIPLALSIATEGPCVDQDLSLKEEVKKLRIIITPEMRYRGFSIEDSMFILQKDAQELGIPGAHEMDFHTLSLAIYNAKLEKEAKNKVKDTH